MVMVRKYYGVNSLIAPDKTCKFLFRGLKELKNYKSDEFLKIIIYGYAVPMLGDLQRHQKLF
jgi:hypothetical protein